MISLTTECVLNFSVFASMTGEQLNALLVKVTYVTLVCFSIGWLAFFLSSPVNSCYLYLLFGGTCRIKKIFLIKFTNLFFYDILVLSPSLGRPLPFPGDEGFNVFFQNFHNFICKIFGYALLVQVWGMARSYHVFLPLGWTVAPGSGAGWPIVSLLLQDVAGAISQVKVNWVDFIFSPGNNKCLAVFLFLPQEEPQGFPSGVLIPLWRSIATPTPLLLPPPFHPFHSSSQPSTVYLDLHGCWGMALADLLCSIKKKKLFIWLCWALVAARALL